tara:strand:- start:241 stop:543 length:303 start_codon:yes stop_codon:yes gene_type:complete
MRKKIRKIIISTINTMNENLDEAIQVKDGLDTVLYGNGGKLDSLDLINLIVAVEQNIEDEFDVPVTLADERAMTQEHSPFRTVESLLDYLEVLLGEMLNG